MHIFDVALMIYPVSQPEQLENVQLEQTGSKETQLMHDVLVASSVNPAEQA